MAVDEPQEEEFHPVVMPEERIVMPAGELPVVRDGTVGGIPAYEADPPAPAPKKPAPKKRRGRKRA